MKLRNLKITLEYDGTNYHGFQFQPDLPTIQGEIERALKVITGEEIKITGAGRTDAGVHAKGQVANFKTEKVLKFREALNSNLPLDISVVQVEEVPLSFNARREAQSREYWYTLFAGDYWPVALRRYSYFIPGYLDVSRIKEAAQHLKGEKDFSSFCVTDGQARNFIRKVYDFDVKNDGCGLVFLIEANSFLYKMVRTIVGTLIEVGRGKRKAESVKEILEAKDRKKAGPTVPPQGLCLVRVKY